MTVNSEPGNDKRSASVAPSTTKDTPRTLKGKLKTRQVTMLSMAGVIGAGLFIGSGHVIALAGPAAFLSYLVVGLLVFSVMRMLGEMAVIQPDSGSFSTYADRAIGKWAGFTIGWLYWWFWVLIIPVEGIAGGGIIHSYLPMVPVWVAALLILLLLTSTNLLSVSGFGEFEFWFALIKIVAIIAFIVLGILAVCGLLPWVHGEGGFARLTSNNGFAPHGYGAVFGGMLVAVGSFFGSEIVTIAAAESRNPERQITRATNLVVWRIAIFYLLSIFLAVVLVNWNDPRLISQGTFETAMEMMNIPAAKFIVDMVVLVTVTSCTNSAIYTASRMLYSLGTRQDAPVAMGRIAANGVPRKAVWGSTFVGVIACLCNFIFPGEVFDILLATTGAMAILVYIFIVISQIRSRNALQKRGEEPPLKMWLFPWLSYLTLIILCAILAYMILDPAFRIQAVMTSIVAIGVICCGILNSRRLKRRHYQ